ncbi:MAG: DUF1465 family protein [Sphingopyxis sp.]
MNGASDALKQANIGSLYADALLLADEARAWFEQAMGVHHAASNSAMTMAGDLDNSLFDWSGRHDPSLRIALSCESLRLTTRLMHIIAWLLLHRAISAGEIDKSTAHQAKNRLGPSPKGDVFLRAALPQDAQRLIEASERLHARVAQMDLAFGAVGDENRWPVNAMIGRLQATF